MTEQLVIAEDLSGLGNISTAVASAIVQSKDISVAYMPANLLSSMSSGFGKPVQQDLKTWQTEAFKHWLSQDVKFKGVLIGYFEDKYFADLLEDFIKKSKPEFVLLDPAFADNGKPYQTMTEAHVKELRQLAKHADYLTPNYTEACFLTESEFKQNPTKEDLKSMLELLNQGGKKTIITGIELDEKTVGSVWLEGNELKSVGFEKLPGFFIGSGDVFSAILATLLWNKVDFSKAAKEATKLIHVALSQTAKQNRERRFGIMLGDLLAKLTKRDEK